MYFDAFLILNFHIFSFGMSLPTAPAFLPPVPKRKDFDKFVKLEKFPKAQYVKQIQGGVKVTHWGVAQVFSVGASGEERSVMLHDCLYIPDLSVNIFSLQRLREKSGSYALSGELGGKVPL